MVTGNGTTLDYAGLQVPGLDSKSENFAQEHATVFGFAPFARFINGYSVFQVLCKLLQQFLRYAEYKIRVP